MRSTRKEKEPERVELRSVFLTKDQIDRADEIAGDRDWSRAKLCRKAIELILRLPDLISASAA